MLNSIFLHGTTFYLTFLGEVSCENGEIVYDHLQIQKHGYLGTGNVLQKYLFNIRRESPRQPHVHSISAMLSDKECSAQRTCLWLSVSSCLPGHTAQEVSLQWGSGSLTGSLKESFSFINVRDTVIITGGVFWIRHELPTKKGNILGGYIIQAANWRAFPAL